MAVDVAAVALAVSKFLGLTPDDAAAAVKLGIDVESVREWRATLALGPVLAELTIDDFDGDGDAEPRFAVRWSGKRMQRYRVGGKRRQRGGLRAPKIKRDKRNRWRAADGGSLPQRKPRKRKG